MNHAQKVKLAKKMAKRTPPKGEGIFRSKAWYSRKDQIQMKLVRGAMRREMKNNGGSIPDDILRSISKIVKPMA